MSWLLSPAAGTINLGSLQDVTITSPANGQVLTYQGGVWINQAISAAVGITGTPVDNQIAVWTSATAIEGDANLTWDGVNLEVTRTTAGNCIVLHVNGALTSGIKMTTTVNSPYSCIYATDTTGGNGFSIQFDPTLQAIDHRLDFVSDLSGELLQLEADGTIRFLGFDGDPIVMESVSGVTRMYIQNGCTLYLEELAAAQADVTLYGQLWVQNTTPQKLNFTDEAGLTTELTGGGAEVNDLSSIVTWANVPNANITVGSVTQHVASINHDLLLNFLAAEHVDWAGAGAGTIHTDNYIENATHTGDVAGATGLTIQPAVVDVAMLSNGVDGEIITWSAAGVAATVAVGTATHVLTSNGVGVAPTFQSVTAPTPSIITVADESADTTCFPAFFTQETGDLAPKTGTNLTFDSSTGDLSATLIGGIAVANLVDKGAAEVITGHWAIPSTINIQNGNYELVLGDAGKTIRKASGGDGETYTIPANSSVAFPIGTLISISNEGGGTLSVAITTDTLTGTDGSTGTKTLGDDDVAVIQKMTSTTWKYAASDL